jgi:hypothetical protein
MLYNNLDLFCLIHIMDVSLSIYMHAIIIIIMMMMMIITYI